MAADRLLELILNAHGGAELVDIKAQSPLWASDSDEEFKEEFPDLLDENDAEAVFDYLIEAELLTESEADEAELSIESLDGDGTEPLEGELLDPDDDDDDFIDRNEDYPYG